MGRTAANLDTGLLISVGKRSGQVQLRPPHKEVRSIATAPVRRALIHQETNLLVQLVTAETTLDRFPRMASIIEMNDTPR